MAADCMVLRSVRMFSVFCHPLKETLHQQRVISRVLPQLQRHESFARQGHYHSRLHRLPRRFYSTKPSVQIQEDTQPRIFSAICIERLPVITQNKTELEKRFEELQDQLELEQSALCDDEVAMKKLSDRKKKLTERDEDESIEIAQVEAQRKEFHEEEEEEFRQFHPANRETNEENNVQSMNRKLQQSLVLMLKTSNACWEMPQGVVNDKESLRQAVERRLQETCGSDLKVKFLSNAPTAVLKMGKILPKCDDKVFFYKAHILGGTLDLGEGYTDFAWLTKDEVQDYVAPEYSRLVRRFLH